MDLDRALTFSRYAQHALTAMPELSDEIAATLDRPFDWTAANATLAAVVAAHDAGALAIALRTLRRRVFVHTLCRDLTARAQLPEVLCTVTTLAEVALSAAVALLFSNQASVWSISRRGRGGSRP